MEPEELKDPSQADAPAESVETVRCRVTARFSEQAEPALTAVAERLPLVPFPPTGTSFAEVVAAIGLTRVTALDRNQNATWTVVRDGRDGSSLFWDHEQLTWIRFGAEELGRDDFGPYEGLTWETETAKTTNTATVTLFDHGLGAIRLEFEFQQDLVPRELAGLVLESIVGTQACHANTGFPLKAFAELGCLVAYRAFFGDSPEPAVAVTVEEIAAGSSPLAWFAPPEGFEPLKLIERENVSPDANTAAEDDRPGPAPLPAFDVPRIGRNRQALMFEDPLTPDCVGSTRLGAMAGVIRQDLFDHLTSLLNTAVPLLGSGTLATGTMTIPWLMNLATITAANRNAPGSGLFGLLRDPRIPATATAKATGGTGLLDRLAWKLLAQKDDNGMASLQREFAAGTMAATMARWGLRPTEVAKLTLSGGDLAGLTESEQIDVVERFEMIDLSTITLTGLPASLPATGTYNWAGLITMSVTGIGGTVNFASVPLGGFISANIGSTANIGVSIRVPDCTFMATVTRALTTAGWLVIGGAALSCFFNPFSCGVMIPLAATLAFLLNNVTVLTTTSTMTTVALDIQFAWDPAVQRVVPQVSVVSSGGTIKIVNTWVTPNVFANLFESAIFGLANLFNIWPGVIVNVAAGALQDQLAKHGVGFPVGISTLEADDGGAWSAPGQSLTMFAGIRPFAGSSAQPYVTQVPTTQVITHKLEDAITVMWHDVNPQPTTTPPGPGKVTAAGLYGGLSLSQNALNYYLFARWLAGGFETTITDPAMIGKIGSLLPAKLGRMPSGIHLWPAVPPRVEVSMDGLTTGGRPLVVFFDDVRACFEVPTPPNDQIPARGIAELSFNFKTTASVSIEWPLIIGLLTDAGPFATTPSDIRVEEYFDLNDPLVMMNNGVAAWQPVAEALAFVIVNATNASKLTKPTTTLAWNRPTPGITQSISGDELYMEINGLRRVLQLLPVFNQAMLLELVDGSGAPTLNALLGTAAAPVSLATMTFGQATSVVRPLLALIKGLPAFPPP